MSSELQHRIYLGRGHEGADHAAALHHWRHRHSRVVRGMPLIAGYVQNRPADGWNPSPYLVCAETWFQTRDDERVSYSSGYYRDIVQVDELNVITPVDAWNAAVGSVRIERPGRRGRWRVLGFGIEDGEPLPPAFSRSETLELRRPAPNGDAPYALSAWTDDRDAADDLARGLGGLSFVAEPATVVVPLVEDWDHPATQDGTDLDPESFK